MSNEICHNNIDMSKNKKLTDEDIASIKKIYENLDITQKELAETFLITQGHLSRIVRGLRRANAAKLA